MGVVLGTVIAGVDAQAASTQFKLVNSSKHTVQAAYVSAARQPEWGANLLQRSLKPQETISLTFDGGCGNYDLRFVVEGGAELQDEEVRFCGDGDTVTLGDVTIKKTKPTAATQR
jgi:hypothetical protein